MPAVLLAVVAGLAGCLLVPGGRSAPDPMPDPRSRGPEPDQRDLVMRLRWLWALLAGGGAWAFLGGTAGVVCAPAAAAAVWVVLGRAESPSARRRCERAAAQLPHLVALIGCGLRAGAAPPEAVLLAATALPGPAADELAHLVARLRLGADPAEVWSLIPAGSGVAPLGRALARAHRSGGSVLTAVDRLAEDLARRRRSAAERRARTVGVRAAVPLGLCLLPAFLLIGVVPMVAGLVRSMSW